MAIIRIEPFDLITTSRARLMSPTGFWASLPRLTRLGNGTAKIMLVTDNLKPSDILEGFKNVAVPKNDLNTTMRWYYLQYEQFLRQTVQVTRHMRVYLVVDTSIGEIGLIRLLGSYGIRAAPLDVEGVPLPFLGGKVKWNRVIDHEKNVWAIIRSRRQQSGMLHPKMLHRLFALDFPVWCSIDIGTYTTQETNRMLRMKDAAARHEKNPSGEAQAEANEIRSSIDQLRSELGQVGSALHEVRFSILVGAESESKLSQRLEVVRGSAGIDMEGWESRASEYIPEMFSPEAPGRVEGSLLPSHALSIFTGSAISYRRRTETRGVYLGTDRNQAPIILDIFDKRHPSYNMVVLGQTGSGKTFSTTLLMLRHLLMGVRLIILDPQGNIDFSWMGEIYHKAIIGTSSASINILDIAHDEMANQISTVIAMLGMLGVINQMDRLEVAIMDQVLMDIYKPLWGRVSGTQVPTLVAVQNRLDDIKVDQELDQHTRLKAEHLSFALEQYTHGSRADLFGHQTTVDFHLDHAVTVYDVSRLPKSGQDEKLRAALLSILVADINQAIRNKRHSGDEVPILFFVDEMGILMRDPVIASHVSSEYKTARARKVGMIVADQDLHSLLGPADEHGLHHGVPIMANSATTLIFNQKASELARVREHFPDLPEGYVMALPTMAQGTCICQLPGDLLQVSVIPSQFELAVLSSKLEDRARARQLMKQIALEAQGVHQNGHQ